MFTGQERRLSTYVLLSLIFVGGQSSIVLAMGKSKPSSPAPDQSPIPSQSPSAPTPAATFTTSTGAVFIQVQGSGISGWQDPSGTVWSAAIPYTAGKDYCAKIGGFLPSEKDYQSLISYFELAGSAGFTEQGKRDFSILFPDLGVSVPEGDTRIVYQTYYATSTKFPSYINVGFNSEYGVFDVQGGSAIRCISRPGDSAFQATGPLPTVGFPIGSTYKTGKGISFTRVDRGRFGPAWQDANGLLWSDFQGDYVNWPEGGKSLNTTIVDSPSVEACAKIGGWVPSGRDFENLIAQLSDDHVNGGYFKDLTTLFPFMRSRTYFGSSSVDRETVYHPMYFFETWSGRVSYDVVVENRGFAFPGVPTSILCVNQPPNYQPIAPAVPAQSPYITSTGAVFVRVQKPGFGQAWKDASGVIWSEYQGDFLNLPPNPEATEIITSSASTEACKKIGGSLPAQQDYERLRTYFDFTTNQGAKDLHAIFPDMQEVLDGYPYDHDLSPRVVERSFSSSSSSTGENNYGAYYGGNGLSEVHVWSTDLRDSWQAVRCVGFN